MSVPGAPRSKTFAAAGSGTPGDFNNLQDTYGLGRTNIAGPETLVAPVAYTPMATPDQVTGVVLPTDGLIVVAFQATWQESVAGAARAAIFLGANQLKTVALDQGAPVTQAAATAGATAGVDRVLASSQAGLVSNAAGGGGSPAAYSGDVTTGQTVGLSLFDGGIGGAVGYELNGTVNAGSTMFAAGPCDIFAAAGTYTVSIKYKASSGNVTAKNRKLWVWTRGS